MGEKGDMKYRRNRDKLQIPYIQAVNSLQQNFSVPWSRKFTADRRQTKPNLPSTFEFKALNNFPATSLQQCPAAKKCNKIISQITGCITRYQKRASNNKGKLHWDVSGAAPEGCRANNKE
jgi:hypothetical protein